MSAETPCTLNFSDDSVVAAQAAETFARRLQLVHERTDRMFAWLLGLEYVAGIAAALVISPRTWAGAMSQTHLHVWAALVLGGLIVSLPIFLALRMPGRALTRHVIAVGQTLMSALFIHLTGGRIETHFHVFGSLAFLAFYRDWRVLISAAAVVSVDHLLRGIYWPQSVYGIADASQWRWLEHAGWVIFEVYFLRIACLQNLAEMQADARHTAQIELSHLAIEAEVARRTADLAQKNKELDEFTYVASHDLQEPVRKLVSFSKLLTQDAGGTLNERATRDLSFIIDAANRMRDLIQDLLAFSRAGRAAMRVEPVALDQCVQRALDSLEVCVRESQAQIQCDALPEVACDKTLVTQVYQNLLGNALKFVPPDRTPKVRLSAARRGDLWELAVTDNGIGIKLEHAARLFKPFQRLHPRGEFEGTGIGLAICKKAVERHGGEIWVESEPDRGACFKFTLPITFTDPLAEDQPCSPLPSRQQPSLQQPSDQAASL